VVAVTDATVRSFAVGASVVAVDQVTLPAPAAFVHATPTVFAITSWGDGLATPITLVDVSNPSGDLALRGSVSVPGWVGDEQKLDIFGGVLRVVTHDGNDGALSRCLTYSLADLDAPTLLGSLDLVRGEQLFATRFDGDRAYVVTFEQVDPLWVLDLSNPAAPKLAGQLVVPGWSTHLVPTGDGRLVAVGVDPADGWHTIVSLFSREPAAPASRPRGLARVRRLPRREGPRRVPRGQVRDGAPSGREQRVLALGPAALRCRRRRPRRPGRAQLPTRPRAGRGLERGGRGGGPARSPTAAA
jgi:hypothetical protein